jgi:flagellar hook-length control protein FliK
MAAVSQSTAAPVAPTPQAAAAAQAQTPASGDDFAAMIAPATATPVQSQNPVPAQPAPAEPRGDTEIRSAAIAEAVMADQTVIKKNSLPEQVNAGAAAVQANGTPDPAQAAAPATKLAPANPVVATPSATPGATTSALAQPGLAGNEIAPVNPLAPETPGPRADKAPPDPADASGTPAEAAAPRVQTQPSAAPTTPTQDAAAQQQTIKPGIAPATAPVRMVSAMKSQPGQQSQVQPVKPNRHGTETDAPQTDDLSWSGSATTDVPALAGVTNVPTHAPGAPQPELAQNLPGNGQPPNILQGLAASLAAEPARQTQIGSSPADDPAASPLTAAGAVTLSADATNPPPSSVATVQTSTPLAASTGGAGEQVAIHIAKALQDGSKTITVELHPAELGRVEIRLSFQSDGLSVQMTVDRQETFDSFSRDRGGLEQQLGQAGVDLGSGGLDLRLGQQSDQSNSDTSGGSPRSASAVPTTQVPTPTAWVGNGLVDILA